MKNEEMLDEIIGRTTDAIINKVVDNIADDVHEEVSDLVHAMASAAMEVIGRACDGDCGCKAKKKARKPKATGEEPVSIEIRTHGIKLSAEDRLRFSKAICDFLRGLEDGTAEPEGAEEEGDAPEEEGDDLNEEIVGENSVVGGVEHITVSVDDDGKTTIKRRIIKPSGETSEEDSDED